MKPANPYAYYLHRVRYRHYRRNGFNAVMAWALAMA